MKSKHLVLSLLALFLLAGLLHANRYEVTSTNPGAVKVDRWTGKSWRLYIGSNEWHPIPTATAPFTVPANELEPVNPTP
jgi:hypothetical protein